MIGLRRRRKRYDSFQVWPNEDGSVTVNGVKLDPDWGEFFSYLNFNTSTGYARYFDGKKVEYLHRIITNCPPGFVVDHINRDSMDNRRCNLRVVTKRENMLNSKRCDESGVTYSYSRKKFKSYTWENQKHVHLGYFKTKDEAMEAVKKRKSTWNQSSQQSMTPTQSTLKTETTTQKV